MALHWTKQPTLKPQDVLVAIKILVNNHRNFTYAELGEELSMSTSEVHSATERAENSKLMTRENGRLEANKTSLREFLIHGLKYVYPPKLSSITRGMPTGSSAPPLNKYFNTNNEVILVWPDPKGESRGWSLEPIYKSVPQAALADSNVYEIFVLIDAIRSGAAREREIAIKELERFL